MFEVLVYVYENYWGETTCPEPRLLERKLNSVGFEPDEIRDALDWLDGLQLATRCTLWTPHDANAEAGESADDAAPLPESLALLLNAAPALEQSALSMRIYSATEQRKLGAECLGFITFLESSGVLPSTLREVVVDRAMATSGPRLDLADLKLIMLMVFWSFGQEPDALILDELCEDPDDRVAH